MKLNKENVLWLDCLGGLIVGVIAMAICRQLSRWDGLPLLVVVFMGIANLTYGGYSLYTTTRHPRPTKLVRILALANMGWLIVCVLITALNFRQMTLFGLVHVLGEGIYVAALGVVEWRWQVWLGVDSSDGPQANTPND